MADILVRTGNLHNYPELSRVSVKKGQEVIISHNGHDIHGWIFRLFKQDDVDFAEVITDFLSEEKIIVSVENLELTKNTKRVKI